MIVCALVFVVLGSVLAELSNLPPRWYITVIIIIIIITGLSCIARRWRIGAYARLHNAP